MKYINIAGTDLHASQIALGCMRISGMSHADAEHLVKTALDEGINFFDHADIYGGGKSEEVFADAITGIPSAREKMIVQSKCGIRPGYFDFSKEHILSSVDGILKRLKMDYIDVLLLHRPDPLMEPEEVAEAFARLHESGKVRYFGVSNENPGQMALLQKYLPYRIVIDQLQYSITNCTMVKAGINVNMENDSAVVRDGGVLDYCRLNEITIQPWSPFQYGMFEGVFIGSDKFPELNKTLDAMAGKKGVTSSAIAIAWILRHPAKMQPIVGTTNAGRLHDICRAADIEITREEWYEIYRSAGNIIP